MLKQLTLIALFFAVISAEALPADLQAGEFVLVNTKEDKQYVGKASELDGLEVATLELVNTHVNLYLNEKLDKELDGLVAGSFELVNNKGTQDALFVDDLKELSAVNTNEAQESATNDDLEGLLPGTFELVNSTNMT